MRRLRTYAEINGSLKTALGMFEVDCGRYPTTSEGLQALAFAPTEGSLTNWHGPYVDTPMIPEDPWGRPYRYHSPAIHSTNAYDLYSLGPDGVAETADDIGNWEKPLRSRIFRADVLFNLMEKLLLAIPILFFIRLTVGEMSRWFRNIAKENEWADWVWFAMTVLILLMLCLPKISGRVE